jgi:NAD(P)-dependent dehydrogenase (short-subunit alcohol dehydrogenase family)
MNDRTRALVIGAGAIGSALMDRWSASGRFSAVVGAGRRPDACEPGREFLLTDHSEASIASCCDTLAQSDVPLSHVVITLGTLHGEDYRPEKSLRELREASLIHVHRINCVLPLLWLAKLTPLLRSSEGCRVAVFSARVGSIGDNALGGWYAYRGAKAALNMGLKCTAIEWARVAPGVKLMAYHPGTVASPLSEPFQANVPPQKLFTPERAAECVDTVMNSQTVDGALAYLDWAGEEIPW